MVRITVSDMDKVNPDDTLLVIGLAEDEKMDYLRQNAKFNEILEYIDNFKEEHLSQIKKYGKSMIFGLNFRGSWIKVMIIGIGEMNKLTSDRVRHLAGLVSLKCKEFNFSRIAIPPFYSEPRYLESMIEGLVLSQYEFDDFKDARTGNQQNLSYYDNCIITIITDGSQRDYTQTQIDKSMAICEAVFYCRDLANSPPNVMNPDALAASAKSLESIQNITVEILDQTQIKELGMNGIISVGKGSENESKVIVVHYNNSKTDENPILLVGKAVTFDTGGISIKPSDRMDEMKFDKSGGCTVLGIMRAIGKLGLPKNVVAIIPAVENMPSGSAYRPGDIIRMYNGKTVEVLNTDAEGRMILADSLSYGISKYSPKCVIDFATLTGACIIALGTNVAGIIGNNDKLIQALEYTSKITGEKIWQLPLYDEFLDLLKSNVATIKNIGGRTGGTITAAAFLSHFVDNIPWAHFDIAGTAWTQDGTAEKSYNPKGSTGFGIRLMVKFLEDNQEFL